MNETRQWRLAAKHWEIAPARADEFRQLGLKRRGFFPHQLRYLHRPSSDGYRIAQRMYGLTDPAAHYELVVHAIGPALRQIPADLFFCRDITWHQQHYGLPGHVAVAGLALSGDRLYTTVRFSDIFQRISRRREHKTPVERLLHGWDYMLLNGILHFAEQRRCREIVFPTADLAHRNTDRLRNPKRPLFDRVYDAHIQPLQPRRQEETWIVEVAPALARLVRPVAVVTQYDLGQTICVTHDIEGGLGHLDVAPFFAESAARDASRHLDGMLEAEARAGVRATYHVVGAMLGDVRDRIESGGHSLGFHSYDHGDGADQLGGCRRVDYRLRGYRVPRSKLTAELTDSALAWHNFEWLASSVSSLGLRQPAQHNGLAKLPIATDDYPLYRGTMGYSAWRDDLLRRLDAAPYVAFGLHDCYAPFWLAEYDELLRGCAGRGTLRRFDEVANALILETGE